MQENTDASSVTAAIRAHLRAHDAHWEELRHAPAISSRDAAEARGLPAAIGCKSIVALTGGTTEELHIFVVPGNRTIDWSKARAAALRNRLRPAPPDVLQRILNLEPGTIPPFGRPLLNATLIVDQQFSEPRGAADDRVAFAAGASDLSFHMARITWLKAAQPQFAPLVRDEN